jgi:hypothetical protein
MRRCRSTLEWQKWGGRRGIPGVLLQLLLRSEGTGKPDCGGAHGGEETDRR